MNTVWIDRTQNQTEARRGCILRAVAVLIFQAAKCKNKNVMSRQFKLALIDVNVVRNAADIRFVTVHHHSDSHTAMLRQGEGMSSKY